jgi:hypothetical protein
MPNLDDEVAAVITPCMDKRQRLTNHDYGDAISKFVEKSSDLFNKFSTFVVNNAKSDGRRFLLQLLDKLQKGVICYHPAAV